jgi:isochorismate pyruvate lyase
VVDECNSLDEVRSQIDRIDHELVKLIAERGAYVRQAARFKATTQDVRAPARVEVVVRRVRALAMEAGADPELVEAVYRTMIARFVEAELQAHRA